MTPLPPITGIVRFSASTRSKYVELASRFATAVIRTPSEEACTSQCAGMSPSQSMPEGFMGAFGSRPLVTAWVMSAVRFSCSSSISRSFFATSASIFEVSRSRKSAMARCSSQWRGAGKIAQDAASDAESCACHWADTQLVTNIGMPRATWPDGLQVIGSVRITSRNGSRKKRSWTSRRASRIAMLAERSAAILTEHPQRQSANVSELLHRLVIPVVVEPFGAHAHDQTSCMVHDYLSARLAVSLSPSLDRTVETCFRRVAANASECSASQSTSGFAVLGIRAKPSQMPSTVAPPRSPRHLAQHRDDVLLDGLDVGLDLLQRARRACTGRSSG